MRELPAPLATFKEAPVAEHTLMPDARGGPSLAEYVRVPNEEMTVAEIILVQPYRHDDYWEVVVWDRVWTRPASVDRYLGDGSWNCVWWGLPYSATDLILGRSGPVAMEPERVTPIVAVRPRRLVPYLALASSVLGAFGTGWLVAWWVLQWL